VTEHAESGERWRGFACGLAVLVALVAAWALLPVAEWIDAFRAWVETMGVWGHVVFALVYIVATVAMAPGSPLTLAAGLAFGLAAFPTVVVAATIGAALAFLSGRYLARSWVDRQTQRSRTFRAVDRAVEAEGWKIVALMRLSPLVPFNLQNYFFGAAKVGFWPYLLATFFGIMPGTLLYVWIGSLGAAASGGMGENGNAGLAKWAAFGIGLAATAIVTVIVSRKARQKLHEAGVDDG
jgi:uncharacterized membrane protein YdjX (TVP38/TMEM64 family)